MDPLEDHSSPASGSCIVKGGWAGVPREGPLCHKKSVLRQITFSIDYGGAHTPWMPHSGYSICPFLISHLPPPSPSQCPPPPPCVRAHAHVHWDGEYTAYIFLCVWLTSLPLNPHDASELPFNASTDLLLCFNYSTSVNFLFPRIP